MPLDFRYTCTEIDSGITDAKESIKNHLDDLLEESCPLFQGDAKNNFIEGYANSLYDDISHIFEGVRSTNEEIRKEADAQIDRLEQEKAEVEGDRDDANARGEELEEELSKIELN